MPLINSPTHSSNAQYSAVTGLTYVFNVIVGTGALAIPAASAKAGWLLSSLALLLLAFVSYVTVTFVVESIAIANAILLTRTNNEEQIEEDESSEDEPLIENSRGGGSITGRQQYVYCRSSFDINRTVEMGQMAKIFLSRPIYQTLFYLTLTIYLYGDLAIYIAAVSKSLRDLTCAASSAINGTDDIVGNVTRSCFSSTSVIDDEGLYRLYTIVFIVVVGPLVFTGIQKTKYLQVTTTLLRWLAFTAMIVISIQLVTVKSHSPVMADFSKLPSMFGVSVYSFMCHHSVPGLITPIKNKRQIHLLLLLDYGLIATFYILLSVTGVFAFENVKDLYTLNFINEGGMSVFLALFPVFTLSTNFPIIGLTLKNNLKTLFLLQKHTSHHQLEENTPLQNTLFTLLTIVPPFLVAMATESISSLVNFTGSFAGAFIQYLIPVFFCYAGRKQLGGDSFKLNPYRSAFESGWWFVGVFIWCLVAVGVVAWAMLF